MSSAAGDAFWMPFTANRQFRRTPRLLASADGMYYRTETGREVLDATSGLWCVNAGHNRPKIVEAVRQAAGTLDFAPTFQMGHPLGFRAAERLAGMLPGDLNHVFFCNSGSEAADTALKIALAYHRLRGEGGRTRLIGRAKGYHGVGFGGISVGGLAGNRKLFGNLLPSVDHLPHTHDPVRNAFSVGQPQHGADYADALEDLVALHDASTIAAVIVEPMAGSAGVLLPPRGYLERLRAICDRHGILLIFDEVITGFGRLGASFAAARYGVMPDIITCAKGLTNGTIPMGAVGVRPFIFETFMQGPETLIELPHGYTYSAHPVACAAAIAALDTYEEEGLFQRAAAMAPLLAEAVHGLRGAPHVIDIRNEGLVAAIELESRPGQPGTRAYDVFTAAFESGLLIRVTGDIIALSPPLIIEAEQIARIAETLRGLLRTVQ